MDEPHQLLIEIANCSVAKAIRSGSCADSPCHKIVNLQSASSFQIPEPWSGRIDISPILFISSNPSISENEEYPDQLWGNPEKIDFFQERFTSSNRWVIEGRALLRNGSRTRGVAYWGHARNRTREILQRKIDPGKDFALTEVVHCKSRGEWGVSEARDSCANRYLERVLSIAAAKALIVYGKHAKLVFRNLYGSTTIPQSHGLGLVPICGIGRIVAFLPAPNERGSLKTLRANVGDGGLSLIRSHLQLENKSQG